MNRDDAILSACERLVEALAADLLDASAEEVLATHTTAAARVAADALRRHLQRAASERPTVPAPPDPPVRPAPNGHRPPEKKP